MVKVTKEQLIKIAKAGFPESVQNAINFESLDMVQNGSKFALFNKKGKKFDKEGYYLSLDIRENFVQFYTGATSFNQMLGFFKIVELNLIEI